MPFFPMNLNPTEVLNFQDTG